MQRNCQLIRVLNIVYDLLKVRGTKTVFMLSKENHVHPKTIRRDLQAIEASKFTLKKVRKDQKTEYLLEDKITNN